MRPWVTQTTPSIADRIGDYFEVQPHPPQEELERIAVRYPVFKILPEQPQQEPHHG